MANSPIQSQLESFFSGEFNSLEGQNEVTALWQTIAQDPIAQNQYDMCVEALRLLAHQSGVKTFHDAEADALWPVLMGHVLQDSQKRSGLSKEALKHLAVPVLVQSITHALVNFKQQSTNTQYETVTLKTEAEEQTSIEPVDFSITSVAGEVSLRIYRNSGLDMRCSWSEDDTLKANISSQDVENWDSVSDAVSQLSQITSHLLGEEVLLNGRIEVQDGRAQVQLTPLHMANTARM